MLQPERKYQLFPKGKVTDSAGKPLDPEQAFAHAMGQGSESSEKTSTGNGLRIRIKEHSLIRRRKISVPELGPMTTVHEVPMDSREYILQDHSNKTGLWLLTFGSHDTRTAPSS
jgi:hypothetical protein